MAPRKKPEQTVADALTFCADQLERDFPADMWRGAAVNHIRAAVAFLRTADTQDENAAREEERLAEQHANDEPTKEGG